MLNNQWRCPGLGNYGQAGKRRPVNNKLYDWGLDPNYKRPSPVWISVDWKVLRPTSCPRFTAGLLGLCSTDLVSDCLLCLQVRAETCLELDTTRKPWKKIITKVWNHREVISRWGFSSFHLFLLLLFLFYVMSVNTVFSVLFCSCLFLLSFRLVSSSVSWSLGNLPLSFSLTFNLFLYFSCYPFLVFSSQGRTALLYD